MDHTPLTADELRLINRYKVIGPLVFSVTQQNDPLSLRMARHVAAAATYSSEVSSEHWNNEYEYHDEFEYPADFDRMNEALRDEQEELMEAAHDVREMQQRHRDRRVQRGDPVSDDRRLTALEQAIDGYINEIVVVRSRYTGFDNDRYYDL